MNLLEHNRIAWNNEVKKGNQWTIPISEEQIQEAKKGLIKIQKIRILQTMQKALLVQTRKVLLLFIPINVHLWKNMLDFCLKFQRAKKYLLKLKS